jgi:hypothetical protein
MNAHLPQASDERRNPADLRPPVAELVTQSNDRLRLIHNQNVALLIFDKTLSVSPARPLFARTFSGLSV